MPIKYFTTNFAWQSVAPWWDYRLNEILESWRGTPWRAGQQVKGQAVDCVRFVISVLDEMSGKPPDDISSMSHPTLVRYLKRRYKHAIVRDNSIEPGDIVATGYRHLTHVQLVGGSPGEIWQAVEPSGVQQTGQGFISGAQDLVIVHRPAEKLSWC